MGHQDESPPHKYGDNSEIQLPVFRFFNHSEFAAYLPCSQPGLYVSSPKVITSWNHLWLALMPAFYVFSLKQLQGQSPDSQHVFTLVNFSECIRFFRAIETSSSLSPEL